MASSRVPTLCHSCRLARVAGTSTRHFSSTTRKATIPPESPHFVPFPDLLQPEYVWPQRQKGLLPVPRDIFPARRPNKTADPASYVKQTHPDMLEKNKRQEIHMNELDRHRARSSNLRKEHFRDGLLALHRRKVDMTQQVGMRSARRQSERARLLVQAEREDQRVTSSSIHPSMIPQKGRVLPHPHAAAIHQQKLQNVQRKLRERQAEQENALHTLYMNARTFITDEEQLNQAVEDAFDINKQFSSDALRSDNVWKAFGVPPTIREMLAVEQTKDVSNFSGTTSSVTKKLADLDQERLKRIAEELSGGRI